MNIENFNWDSKNQSANWSYNGKTIKKKYDNAYFASLNKQKNLVYIEAGENYSQDQIYYLSFNGEQIFKIDKVKGKMSWQQQDRLVEVNCKGILNGQYYIEQDIVVVITAGEQGDKKLKGFALDGTLLFVKQPPKDYTFNYLSTFMNQPSVVCNGGKANADAFERSSWHFLINTKTGEMSKENMAY